jgi:TatD DNase family protein
MPDVERGKSNYFDTHTHYDDPRFDGDRDELLGTLLPEAGVARVINVGADIKGTLEGIKLAEKYNYISASAGVHPHNVKGMKDGDLDVLFEASKHEKVVAIGEIGLDYYYENSPRDTQLKRFRDQMEVAAQTGLPVIIHSRDAHVETYGMLKEYEGKINGGIIHCFSGNAELAQKYIKLGYLIAFGGVITFPNAADAADAAYKTPVEYIVLETDCPYIAPIPFRGKRNDSRYLTYICKRLAVIKGIPHEEAARVTFENAAKFFGI